MGQTLSHGVYLPAEGERNCYSGLASNWNLLDTAIGDTAGKASATHTHGNITNDGKVGTTANLPLITGTSGTITTGSFGTSANTFCEGNDSRLSDARTPVAHTHTKSDVTDLFNSANVWTGNNSYKGIVSLDSSSDIAEQFKQKLPKDVSTSNDAMARVNSLVDSAGHYVVVETIGHWSNYVAKNITLKYKNDSTKQGAVEFRLYSDGSGIFYPQSPFGCDLGNIYNKWKTLNGINPGALSLPTTDSTKWVDLSGSIVINGSYTYTPTVDGWVSVELKNSNMMAVAIFINQGNMRASCFGDAPQVTGGDFYGSACIPVRANIAVDIYARGSNFVVSSAYFIPCQGNV